MGNYKIKKGFDIQLDGKPSCELVETMDASVVGVLPQEIHGVRWRLLVDEGDRVRRGTALMESKLNDAFKLRAPASGVVSSISRGERRFVDEIRIDVDSSGDVEHFTKYEVGKLDKLNSQEILDQLIDTGYLAYLIQRPFSRMADVGVKPKSIFVNAMSTGPFQADAGVVVEDSPEAFQAGLNLLTKLTDGKVNLCVAKDAQGILKSAKNVDVHFFSGVHPAGNTSVHISKVDPMAPTDVVWSVKAVDLVQIGKLFLEGVLPESKIVSLGGNCVVEGEAKHYKVRVGAPVSIFADKIEPGDIRYISGDVLSGRKISSESVLGLYQSSLTVIPESEERHFMGWAMPGFTDYSFSHTFISSAFSFIFGRKLFTQIIGKSLCRLNTNTHGGRRAMVLTGYYDRVMPMNIMVDYLVRAVLAKDTDEAIQLGILETDPEDFALCDFICPSKTEVQAIIREGLELIEEEGI